MKTSSSGRAGWRLKSRNVDLFLTEKGGHMAPVSFYADSGNPVSPYYISPWQTEKCAKFPDPVLAPLRGDFFCMPFGANTDAVRGEKYTCHGEPASGTWTLKGKSRSRDVSVLELEMRTRIRKGRILKKISLVDGHNVVYSSHILEGYSGAMPLGHHAILALPDKDDAARLSVGRFDLGMTNPGLFANPASGEYQSLDIGREFSDLAKVPVLDRNMDCDDCTLYPRRRGFEDLIQIFKKPRGEPAWSAVVFRDLGYLWFSLKDAAVLPGTVLWISNRGRHGFPWNGRNLCLAVEDTCSYFANGLKDSISANRISKAGFRTALELSPKKPTAVNYIQGVVKVPYGFGDRISDARFGEDAVTLVSSSGKKVEFPVRTGFLRTGEL